jgi:hypothetical protein
LQEAQMRVFSGVILGFLLFELLWFAVFRVTNTDRHAPASLSFQVGGPLCSGFCLRCWPGTSRASSTGGCTL